MIIKLEQAYVKRERVGVKPGENKALEHIKGAYKTDGERYFSKPYSNTKWINSVKFKDDRL